LSNGFFDVFDALNQAMAVAANFQTKAVGAQVNGCKQGFVVHEGKGSGEAMRRSKVH